MENLSVDIVALRLNLATDMSGAPLVAKAPEILFR